MLNDQPMWKNQCDAARGLREDFGSRTALGYLVGEKLRSFLRGSRRDPALAADVPAFVAEIKDIFEPGEIREYLSGVRRLGPLGHVLDDEAFEAFRSAGAVDEDVVTAAEDVILIEGMKKLLLGSR